MIGKFRIDNLANAEKELTHILNYISDDPWLATENAVKTVLNIAQRQDLDPEAVAAKIGRKLENTQKAEIRDGVGILEISGTIFRYANLFTRLSGATSIPTPQATAMAYSSFILPP